MLILDLRLIEEGVERARFKERFGVELDEIYDAAIARLIDRGCWNPMPSAFA